MARGINKVILIGNLGADPESRSMPSGMNVTNLRIATSESWKDKQTGEMQERTEWHSVAMFGRLAEISAQYLRKGSQVYIEGRLRTRKWQDKEGQRPLHDRDRRRRDADARRARRRGRWHEWRRWQRAGARAEPCGAGRGCGRAVRWRALR